jgi:hypothetical protein
MGASAATARRNAAKKERPDHLVDGRGDQFIPAIVGNTLPG